MQNQETIEKLKHEEMKPLTETQQKIYDFLSEDDGKNANSNVELIDSCLPLNKLTILNTLKTLTKNGIVTKSDSEPPTYSLAKVGKEVTKISDKKSTKTESVKKEDEVFLKNSSVRNTDKYVFSKQSFSKSRLVLEVLKTFIASHPDYSLEQVQEVWKSSEIQKRYGIIIEISKAKPFCDNGRERHFMKNVLTIGKKRVVVCNQWSDELLIPVLKIAASLKYKITKE